MKPLWNEKLNILGYNIFVERRRKAIEYKRKCIPSREPFEIWVSNMFVVSGARERAARQTVDG